MGARRARVGLGKEERSETPKENPETEKEHPETPWGTLCEHPETPWGTPGAPPGPPGAAGSLLIPPWHRQRRANIVIVQRIETPPERMGPPRETP